jgi:cell division protein FtsB
MLSGKKRKKNIFTGFFLTPYFFTLLCLVILAAIVLPVYKNALQRHEVNKEISDLHKEIQDLEASNKDLKKMKTYLESDAFAEKEARLDFGLKKEGEQVAIIEDGSNNVSNSGANGGTGDNSGQNKNSNLWKWWNYFFK